MKKRKRAPFSVVVNALAVALAQIGFMPTLRGEVLRMQRKGVPVGIRRPD